MPLFQRAPEPDDAAARAIGPPVSAVLGVDAAEWRARVYRGDVPQLTARAVVVGSILGFGLSLTNVYVGLKTGWFLHVAITAAVLSVASGALLVRLGVARAPMTLLENACVQSVASSAGYATGNTLVSAVPALLLVTGAAIPWTILAPWVLGLALLGVSMAAPLKRRMIDEERLRFPTGTAAATVLQALYGDGREAIAKARALGVAAVVAALGPIALSLRALGPAGARRSLVKLPFDASSLFLAAGAIVGPRVALSMLLGALVLATAIAPRAIAWTWVDPSGHAVAAATSRATAFAQIGLWYGASLIVAYGVLRFALEWRTIGRALGDLRAPERRAGDLDVPARWTAIGVALATLLLVALAWIGFAIPPHLAIAAVALTFFLALVACRATGEADVTPVGAMGKITQLVFGVLSPQAVPANLMTAAITSGASLASADLLTDLKAGHLLGANPRRQFLAQLSGIASGTIASCAAYAILVPDARVFRAAPGEPPIFAAPAAHQWEAVARVLAEGIDHLHPMAREGLAIGGALGAALAAIEVLAPRSRRFLPSAMALGLGLMLPLAQPIAMAIGAALAWGWARIDRAKAERLAIPISSGLIVGESIAGIAVQALNQLVFS